jgi:LysW-gamma-L-lysine carboxypeptidase
VRIEGGEIVGRGAVDAKGPLAAFVAAATAPPGGVRVTIAALVEEEAPTSAGARHLAAWPAPDWCVIGEPSGWDGVTFGYKGRLVLRVALTRAARHGAAPGPTCAEEALAVWGRIRAAAAERSPGQNGFAALDCRLERIGTDGDGLSERAELRVGYRLPPGCAIDEVEAEVRAICAAPTRDGGDADLTVERLAAEPPARASRASPLARAFVAAIAECGGTATFKVKSGTSDMNVLLPAWGCPTVAYGPGDASLDHTPHERLALAEYGAAISVLRGVLRRAGKP